jgi:hypothetical protein
VTDENVDAAVRLFLNAPSELSDEAIDLLAAYDDKLGDAARAQRAAAQAREAETATLQVFGEPALEPSPFDQCRVYALSTAVALNAELRYRIRELERTTSDLELRLHTLERLLGLEHLPASDRDMAAPR